jgi:uncharacterized PurR-regulated membrane protein YhhQ (DUF165 family)
MKELDFFDKPKNRKGVLRYFFLSLVLLILIDFFIHKHVEFPWEAAPAFYAVYGFTACVSLIFIAKLLRYFVKRDEDYYNK